MDIQTCNMGEKVVEMPSVCIIDDSLMATKIYRYLIEQLLVDPKVTTFNHPWDVNVLEFKQCSLIIIDEIMDDMTGTDFLKSVLNEHFDGRFHEFPNVIFASSLDSGDINERIKSKRLDTMIPAYRVIQKPITPAILRQAIISICPNLEKKIRKDSITPNSELPWLVSIKKAIDEIIGINEPKPTNHCMVCL